VYRRALRLLGDEASARDVCHDVFVQVLRAGASWSPPSPVGWLYTATTNACLNLLRGRRRWRRMLEGRPRLPTPDAELPLGALLKSVPARLQEIAIYYGLEGLSQSEIAVVLGVSEKTVWSRLSGAAAAPGGSAGPRTNPLNDAYPTFAAGPLELQDAAHGYRALVPPDELLPGWGTPPNPSTATPAPAALFGSATPFALSWSRKCLGFYETLCTYQLHRITLPEGTDTTLASSAETPLAFAVSPDQHRVAVGTSSGIFVLPLP
jgi:RNA polymerase sigma factor (sigma-70 family)